MAEQKLIKKYNGIISEVQTEIKKLENDTRVLNKLYVILDVLHDEPISEIIKKHDISQGTAYNWIKQWNDGGIEGLKRKKGSKGQSKLTNEQLILLDEIIQKEELKTAREVKEKIEKEFSVEYSIRSVERLMKKLDYSYTKPYKIYTKMPADAEEQLKKTPNI
ncbi:helix-turn-helix domain-containing protein [uncultured Methanobrevibacter sp.]|uniref:helix-turn-helix domain-containing protein n=1 Tax=uncultured Methanobrevibacter sp. TaxID=253161 RepID=UPI002616F8CD|nr:helix-turn-helix domain-containing protein [uncultured Methanobrevibacter sp.]